METFSYALQDYIEERVQPSILKSEKTNEWKKLISDYDLLYEKVFCTLPEEAQQHLQELLSTADRKAVAEMCIAYKAGLVDGIFIKDEAGFIDGMQLRK